jgi:hypothetical protein
VSTPFIFVSCGQYTDAEKILGKSIVKMIKTITGLDAFFAEEVQDLNGLDSNILNALRDCTAVVTVMHPRGKITRPDGKAHVRASVWIEQEIAIATYIQRTEKRPLPVIAFVHESVSREGIRELLHLNPIRFAQETEVLAALPELLQPWRNLPRTGMYITIRSANRVLSDEHWIRQIVVSLTNDSNQRITRFNCLVRVPVGLLKHWSTIYAHEAKSEDERYRCFRFDETSTAIQISPRSTVALMTVDICTHCAADSTGEIPAIAGAIIGGSKIEAKVWLDGREHSAEKTIKELADVA